MDSDEPQNLHVAIIPSPGMGHLIPLIQFAIRLHVNHNLSSTLLVDRSHQKDPSLNSLPHAVSAVVLPAAPLDDLPTTVAQEVRICLSISRNLSAIRSILSDLQQRPTLKLVALVVDLFSTDALDVARELSIPAYILYPTNAMCLSFFFHLPSLDAKFACEYRDLPNIHLPGCTPIHGRDVLNPAQDRSNDAYKHLLHQCRKYYEADGIMVNTFHEMEPGACQQLQATVPGRPPVYIVGPLVKNGDPVGLQDDPTDCVKWLDGQPTGSVLYVSFGSGGVLSSKQITELAMGLEMSGQRFLWVIRLPREGPADADFFGISEEGDSLEFLPEGFLERTKGVGLVVPNWAPQVRILSHAAVGGFLTHCGWNSTMESLVHGVPMATWPLYAEQRMNSVMLVEDAKVAIRMEGVGMGAVVEREEVNRVVRMLMEEEEGKKVRNRAKFMKDAARVAHEEGGKSRNDLAEVVCRWKIGVGEFGDRRYVVGKN